MSGDVSVACSIIDTDMLVVSHNHVAASGILTVSNFTFFYFFFAEKKNNTKNKKKTCLTVPGSAADYLWSCHLHGRQFVNGCLRRASPSLRGNSFVCFLGVVCTLHECARVCTSACVCSSVTVVCRALGIHCHI